MENTEIKECLENIIDISEILNPISISLLMLLWRDCHYCDDRKGNIIYTINYNKLKWISELSAKPGTINNSLTSLIKTGFMRKLSTSVYVLNSEYFYKGDRNSRHASLENFKLNK